MILSGMYLFAQKMLKAKRWTPMMRRLPSLDRMELYAYRANMFGVPLLLLAVILGAIWAHLILPNSFWWDTKVWTSLLVVALYSFSFYKQSTEAWQGRKVAWWNILSFAILMLNFLLADPYSQFHKWS
jgi:HemX protein